MLSLNQKKMDKLGKIKNHILKSYKLFEIISKSKFFFLKNVNIPNTSQTYKRIV